MQRKCIYSLFFVGNWFSLGHKIERWLKGSRFFNYCWHGSLAWWKVYTLRWDLTEILVVFSLNLVLQVDRVVQNSFAGVMVKWYSTQKISFLALYFFGLEMNISLHTDKWQIGEVECRMLGMVSCIWKREHRRKGEVLVVLKGFAIWSFCISFT